MSEEMASSIVSVFSSRVTFVTYFDERIVKAAVFKLSEATLDKL